MELMAYEYLEFNKTLEISRNALWAEETAVFAVDAEAGTVATSGPSVPKSGTDQTGSSPAGAVSQPGSVAQSSVQNSTTPPNLVPLDIDMTQSSNEISFEKSGDSRSYTAKEGFLISELRRGTAVVHKFENEKYPYKVIIEKKGDDDHLRILFPSTGSTENSEAESEPEAKSNQAQTATATPAQTAAATPAQQGAQQAQVTQPQQSGAATAQPSQNQPTQPQTTVLTPARRLGVASFTEQGKALPQNHLGTSHQNFAANLHLFTKTNDTVKPDDTTQYKVCIGQDGYIYVFNEGAQCVEVKYMDGSIWKIGNSNDYPARLEFSITSPPHVLIATKNQTYTYRDVNGRWLLGSHTTNVPSQMDISKVTIHIGTDASCAQAVLDETKYMIKTFDDLKIFYYEFFRDVYCAGIIYENQYLWKYDANFGFHPKRIYFHKDVMTVVVDFATFYIVYKFEDAWKFDSKVDKDFHDDQIELVTLDTMKNSPVINDFTQYRVIDHYYLRQYKFNQGAKCVSLRYMQKEVWARIVGFANHFPKSIVYNINTGNFFIDFDTKWYYVYVFDQASDRWYLVHKDETNKPANIPEVPITSPSQPANESQNANPNAKSSDPEDIDDIDVRDMRSGSMGSDSTDADRARSGRRGSISQPMQGHDSAGPKKQVDTSDVEVHEVRAGAQDSDASDLEFVRNETQKARPSEMNVPRGKSSKRIVSDIEIQEVRKGAHSSFDSDIVVEEVRVGRKRRYESDVIVEEVRHGEYDSDASDLDVQEIRRGQKDSDDSNDSDDSRVRVKESRSRDSRRGKHHSSRVDVREVRHGEYDSASSGPDVREVRHGEYDSASSGLDVREVRRGDYDSDASEFDVREVRRGAYDSDASHFDVEEVRYGSNTDSSEMRVREVRHGQYDSDASEVEFRTRGSHMKRQGHGAPHGHQGYRSHNEYSDYGSPYDSHSHSRRHQHMSHAQRMPGQRYSHASSGYSHPEYDSYDTDSRENFLLQVDIMNKSSTRFVEYYYDRHTHCDNFVSRPPYLFSYVLEGGRVIWKPQGGNYPNKVMVHTNRYGQASFKVFFPKGQHKSQYRYDTNRYEESTVDSEIDYYKHRGPHTHSRHQRHFNGAERHLPAHNYKGMAPGPYNQFGSRSTRMHRHGQPFNEYDQHRGRHSMQHYDPSSPFQIQYEYHDGKVVGVNCNGVSIWRRQGHDPYPQSTQCISDILMIAIIFNKFHFHIYKFNGFKWNKIRASVEKILELDISKKSSSQDYYYASKNHVDTYLAVDKYLFNKVKLSYINGYHTLSTDIWTTDKPTEYADKIIVNRFGHLSTKTEVTIHFINGCEVTYLSGGLMKTFYRYRWSETASKISDDIQIMTLDDDRGYEINNVTKFDIYAHYKVDKPESSMKGIYKYEVVFYLNAICVKVRVRNRKVFKTNPRLSGNYPTKIVFNLETNRHSFEFSDDVYNYVFEEKIPSYLVST
ncbi:hypothetical protein MACJ_001794 [Theileria orientalis]|uniref:Uncharacterized protein n=1 Tax=Theileria orientalis TaxID=68886 RepID=A0A976QS57_THEOR|nr:hypothetical protein MACJ_001794 [Theileria orientalis]